MEGTCFDAYLALCAPYRLPDHWAVVPADPHAYCGPEDPSAALAQLAAGHSPESLIAAGIAERSDSGELRIHSFLSTPFAPLVALRYHGIDGYLSQGRAINLMTAQGCVRGYRYPLFAALFDDHTYRAIEGGCHELILTDTIDDAIVLRSLGFAAVSMVGLADLNDQGITLLGKLFGATRHPSNKPVNLNPGVQTNPGMQTLTPEEQAASRRIYPGHEFLFLPGCHGVGKMDENFVTLTIARWSPSSLSLQQSPAALAALQFLGQLQQFVNVDLHDVNHWTLSPSDAERIAFGLARREVGWIMEALWESFDKPRRDLVSLFRGATPPPDMAMAIQLLEKAYLSSSSEPGFRDRCTKAVADYRAALEREILGPLARQIVTISDPFERARHAHWTELYALYYEKMLEARQQMLIRRSGQASTTDPELDRKTTSELLAISKQLLAAAPRVPSCISTNRPTRTGQRPTSPQPRFDSLGFPTPN